MKLVKTAVFLLISLNCFSQSISLPKESKLKFGDDPEWASPAFNDREWQTQIFPNSFNDVKNDSSFCWYRIKLTIPSTLKTNNGKGLKLRLGKIDDVDQTYFNGKLIGETGSLPPNYVTQWSEQRVYTIPENMVQWDKENLIAVRIYNLIGGMGMWEGPYRVEPLGWIDEVSVSHSFMETAKNSFTAIITFANKTDIAFSGTVKYWIADKANKKFLFTDTKNVQLPAKAGAETEVTFSNFQSSTENVFNVGYQINDNNSTLFTKKEQFFIAANHLEIPVLKEVKPAIKNKIQNNYNTVAFQDERFTGYLGTRFEKNLTQRLLKVDEFGLIGSYLDRPGIHPWAGEHIGKYLEAACNVWKLTGDKDLKKQMDRLMYQLINTQKEDGYLGTYTPDQYWTSWDVWSHKYNLHGLLTYYAATGYKPALVSCVKIGNLLCKTFGNKPGQMDIITAGTHMGMAATSVLDAMVELYKYTADKKYLDFCYYILEAWDQDNGPKVISSILETGKINKVGNNKSYEMLSNYVGLIKLYQITGDKKFLKATELAWQDVVTNQLYITGTSSSHEYFQEDNYLPAGIKDNMGEGCVTTTWVQLNQNLFETTGDIKYLNELEKTVYNHLLAAENPQTGCVSYYTPLIGKKPYTCHITCCQSSVPRGIALVPKFTFGNMEKTPTVLFYEPAFYKDKVITSGKNSIDVAFNLEGNFPESGNLVLTVTCSKPGTFPISLRVPYWCSNYTAQVGDSIYKGSPNQFLTITRKWKSRENVTIRFDMPATTIPGGKNYPNLYAVQRGPQVLAFDESLNSVSANNLISNSKEGVAISHLALATESGILPANWIGKQAYSVKLLNSNEKIILVPFAEASQTDGEMRVWLPVQIKN